MWSSVFYFVSVSNVFYTFFSISIWSTSKAVTKGSTTKCGDAVSDCWNMMGILRSKFIRRASAFRDYKPISVSSSMCSSSVLSTLLSEEFNWCKREFKHYGQLLSTISSDKRNHELVKVSFTNCLING